MQFYQVIVDGEVRTEIPASSESEARSLMNEHYPNATYVPVERVSVAIVRDGVVENIILAESPEIAAEVIALREQEAS